MRPYSKVIQLVSERMDPSELSYLALCEDGSIWRFYPPICGGNPWELMAEMDGGKYTINSPVVGDDE